MIVRSLSAKVRQIDDTMLHRRLGTILSYVTDDFSVRFFLFSFEYLTQNIPLKIINDDGILVISDVLKINVKRNSTSWIKALETFDRDVDLNSLTKKEVRHKFQSIRFSSV